MAKGLGLFELKQELQELRTHVACTDAEVERAQRTLTASETAGREYDLTAINTLTKQISAMEADPNRSLLKVLKNNPMDLMGGGQRDPNEAGPRRAGVTLRQAMQHATAEQREEIQSFARYLGGDMSALADLRPGSDGGVFIPTMVAGVIERNIAAFTPVLNNCKVWPTLTGEPTKYPVISDSEEAEILVPAELTGADDVVSGDTPPTAVGGPTMGAYKFSSKPIFIPRETITDSTLNVLDEIMFALLARIYRHQNLKFTKGSGSGEPTGFLHDATPYNVVGSGGLDLDIALDLAYSVPALYRPNGIYMASDTTIKFLRKLKTGISGDKRNLWKDVFEEGNATLGTPAKLHGYPIIVNNDMDSVSSDGTFLGVAPLAFGDFQRFVVRQAEQGSPYTYRYTVPAKDGGAVIAFQRSDSKLLVSTAINKLTGSLS